MSEKTDKEHGGKRVNSGRKKKEETRVVSFRVRKSKLEEAKKSVKKLKKTLK